MLKLKVKMSALIAICIFLYVRHFHDPIFFAMKNAFKITKLKIYFEKKEETNHYSNNTLITNNQNTAF